MTKLINREKRQRKRMIAFGMIGGAVVVAVVVVVSLLSGSGEDDSSSRKEDRRSEWSADEMPSTVDSRDEWENGFGGAEEASAPADAAPAEDGSFGRAREEAREEMMRALLGVGGHTAAGRGAHEVLRGPAPRARGGTSPPRQRTAPVHRARAAPLLEGLEDMLFFHNFIVYIGFS